MIISALTGASFVRCCFFDYPTAIRVLNDPPAVSPNNVWEPVPWIESSAQGTSRAEGAADLDRAIALAPESPGVRLIVADAYTYGNVPDPQRAFAEASFELAGGLNTPRLHAIFARVYLALGNQLSAAAEFRTHIELVTTQLVQAAPFTAGATLTLPPVLGRSCEIPILPWPGGLSILTSSRDYRQYFAGFQWVAVATGTYRIWVTSFESVNTGDLIASRW